MNIYIGVSWVYGVSVFVYVYVCVCLDASMMLSKNSVMK